MLLKEYIEEENTLNEGIKYFKDSKRIRKLSKKIEKKINLLSKQEEMTEVFKTTIQLNNIADEFELLEKNYKFNTYGYKMKYKALEQKYLDLIKIINKESVISALKKIGSVGLFSAAIFFVYKGLLTSGASNAFLEKASDSSSTAEAFGKVVDEMSTKAGAEKIKARGNFARSANENILKINSKVPELLPQGAAENAEAALATEKEISAIGAGTAAITSNIVLKVFYKLTDKIKRNNLYYKTRMTLEKLNKI